MDLERMKAEVEVSDDHILLGKPIVLMKYGKKLTIKQVNWFYDWEKFSYNLAVFLMYYNQTIESAPIPTTVEELSRFRESLKLVIANGGLVDQASKHEAFNALCKICAYTGASIKWMKKQFTIDDWLEVFVWVYLYNIVGKKKGLRTVFDLVGIAQLSLTQPKAKFSASSRKGSRSKN